MPKRKRPGADEKDGGQSIPLPVQIFLWRQSSPFIRPKLGKLSEASCVSFERVLVQNILHGLSPSLCEAIQSMSRWKLIQAAFPHIMHSCAAMLDHRYQSNPDSKFSVNETKLMYTLHWSILDAASECEDLETEKSNGNLFGKSIYSYLHSLDTIQLFVYLFAPLVHTLKDSDFQSLKLENGLRLWQPLWEYRQPDVPCFSTPVKPKRNVLKAQRNLMKVNTNAANIYIGKGSSTENLFMACLEEIPPSRSSYNEAVTPQAPLARLSDVCPPSISETQSATVEVVCERCNKVVFSRYGEPACQCEDRRFSVVSSQEQKPTLVSPIDKEYVNKQLESAITSGTRVSGESVDFLSASYFDVAVLRCLFSPQWAEEGIYWALRYIHQRLLEVGDEMNREVYCRERSKSLPVPDIQITPVPSPVDLMPETPEEKVVPETAPATLTADPVHQKRGSISKIPTMPNIQEGRREPASKKMRGMAELRHMIGDKVKQLRRRESVEQFELDKIQQEDRDKMSLPPTVPPSVSVTEIHPPRPSSALAKLAENEEDSVGEDDRSITSSPVSDIVRRKSMPTLMRGTRPLAEDGKEKEGNHLKELSAPRKDSVTRAHSLKPELLHKPIITITKDSPSPTPATSDWSIKKDSEGSDKSTFSTRPISLSRSMTDSNIQYDQHEEMQEAPGSAYYIQDSGHLNYTVVLQAVHYIAGKECSSRISSVLLNMLNCLLDLGIIKKKADKSGKKDGDKDEQEDKEKEVKEKKSESGLPKDPSESLSAYQVGMESIIKVFKNIGCPHGCGDGYRGSMGDHLRAQGMHFLNRLQRANQTEFKKFLRNNLVKKPLQDIIDFLHAFLGFCVDPSAYAFSPQGSKKYSQDGRTPYATNFGEPRGPPKTVEGIVIVSTLKALLSKFVEQWKELLCHENIGLYCDIRQYLNYVKETHGSSFRMVALSGLSDAIDRKKKETKKTTKVIRRTVSMTSESGDELRLQNLADDTGKGRKSLFRRRSKKQVFPPYGAASDSEMLEEPVRMVGRNNAPVSLSAAEDDPPSSGPGTPKRKFSKFSLAWKKGHSTKSDHEDDSASEMPPVVEQKKHEKDSPKPSGDQTPKLEKAKSEEPKDPGYGLIILTAQQQRTRARMSFRAASHATLTFLSARKRIEDGLRNWSKRRMSKRGSVDDETGRRGSVADLNSTLGGTEVIVIREKKLVDSYAVKSGMLRFNFIMDCCHPGAIPDPHLIAALLDLEAPVVARASLLLECAYFVYRCNRGDWPNWMKLNLPSFRQPGTLHNRGQPSGFRRNIMLQRAAGRMFHQWGEAIGNRMWELLSEENHDRFSVIHQVKDDKRKQELRTEDDEEDFLDEASVNHTGSDCPYALKMIACQLLLEITTFLRETYQYIPKSKVPKKEQTWDKSVQSRRWSSVLGSPGHSERSNSKSSQGEHGEPSQTVGSPGDRKISFAVLGHAERGERSDSIHSSTTSISLMDAQSGDSKGRRLATGRKLLKMRRGSGHNSSLRHNRSFKLKRGTEGSGSIKRVESSRTRKVSTQSLRSEKSDDEHSAEGESGMMSDDQESPDAPESEEQDYSRYMPWIKVVVQLANTSNFICGHQNFCHPNCYERQRRSCTRLITALKHIYDSEPEDSKDFNMQKWDEGRRNTLREKLKRRESLFQPSSPTRRRESTPLLDKIKNDIGVDRAKIIAALEKTKEEAKTQQKPKEELPVTKYIKSQVQNLTQSPLSIIAKSGPILSQESFIDMLPVAWELLLESDQELAAAAATVFILSSVKAPDHVQLLMTNELQHDDVNQRINAILRFGVLWRFRYQIWPRMEDSANVFFKVPPPSIDFVLPSPTIGMPQLTVIDPPWTPHFKTKVEEVTLNQEGSKTFVTATTTRRKQQQEMIHKALLAEEDRRREARENFRMTMVPVNLHAAYEPALHHAGEDHEEGEEEKGEHVHSQHLQLAQHVFPSCICSAAVPIIHLLDDLEVNLEGVAVCSVAEKVIWSCLVEEPALFLRTFLEKLTNRERQEELIYVLRKLLYHLNQLPPQTAHTFFNYMVGFVMFYVRSPAEGGQEAIAQALSLIWQIVPSVNGIYFKDLKQTLKKEQCDPTLLITANVPSAKKLIVHGPDLSSIPSQFPIQESDKKIQTVVEVYPDTQFLQILQDSLDFFNIPEDQHTSSFLVDFKTNQMHNLNSYVRDFYFFRRNFYPQLSLVNMNPDDAKTSLQKQAFTLKAVEIGKVLFSMSVVLAGSPLQMQSHVSFLHEELLKLPSFPRKALEAEFGLHHGAWGKELYSLDMLHKYAWAKLMGVMFQSMSSTTTTWSGDLPLFLNVVNGALVLHAEDTAMLRLCISIFINASRHFKQVFATSGFLLIMPIMLKVYSGNQGNPLLLKAIEFACRAFYTLHRKPFMLQMFGSIAPIMDMNDSPAEIYLNKVAPRHLFKLLCALEGECTDDLDIMGLVDGEKPLQALDFCYLEDPDEFYMIDAINMCVTVIAYAPDSSRAEQMLVILESIMPHWMRHMKQQTDKENSPMAARGELNILTELGIAMRALVSSCEVFARNFSGPQRHLESVNASMKPTHNHSNHSPQGPIIYHDDPSDFRFMEEGFSSKKSKHHQQTAAEDAEMLSDFRRPRSSILCIVAEFFHHSHHRTKELRRIIGDPTVRSPELLDHRAHNRLADVAHTLLKVAPYDPATMGCPGLKRYMSHVLPLIDWSQEAMRPGLNLLLRRLERIFSKMYKKPVLRRRLDWEAAAALLNGIYDTLTTHSFIAHLPHLKTLINVCLNIVLTEDSSLSMGDSVHSVQFRSDGAPVKVGPPTQFCSAVVKLTAMQMQALGDQYSLEHICGGMSVFPTTERTINLMVNLILPLCIRMGCGRRDTPKMRLVDVNFALTILLHALVPPTKLSSSSSKHSTEGGRSGSISYHSEKRGGPREIVQNVAFLGLKILMVCFEKQLGTEWYRITKTVTELGSRLMGGLPLWRFLDFVVTVRPPLYILLQPFIQFKMMKAMCDTEQEYFLQQMVHQKTQGYNMPHPKCKGTILIELAAELKHIRDEFITIGEMRSRTTTMATDRSDISHNSQKPALLRSSSIQDILEHHAAILRMPLSIQPYQSVKMYSRATLMNQSSVHGPAQCLSRQSTLEGSPVSSAHRKLSRRISAFDGSKILEKYSRQPSLIDDEGLPEADATFSSSVIASEASNGSPGVQKYVAPRKLQRQASIYQHRHITKQHAICETPPDERGVDFVPSQASVGQTDRSSQPATAPVVSAASEAGLEAGDASSSAFGIDPRTHRLQRQDAKSRKTFKIKRHRSTIKGSVIRSATVKGTMQGKHHPGTFITTISAEPTRIPGSLERLATQPEEDSCDVAEGGPTTELEGAIAMATVENETKSIGKEPKGNRKRFIPRARSHDDDTTASVGTVRGRIAQRHGQRVVNSRSPSTSPVRYGSSPPPSPPEEPAGPQAYVAKCDSVESLSNEEQAALLKDDDKTKSDSTSSLMLYLDELDMPDTCV